MVSLSAEARIAVGREPADVWRYVSDLRNQDQWVEGMSGSEQLTAGAVGRGTQVRGTYTYGGGSAPMLLTITEFREGRRLAFESEEGPFPTTGSLSLERQGAETLVINQLTAGSDHFFTSIMFTVFRPLTKWMMRRQLQKELRNLKAILERDA